MTRYVCLSMGGFLISLGLMASGCIIDECDDGVGSSCWSEACDDCAWDNEPRQDEDQGGAQSPNDSADASDTGGEDTGYQDTGLEEDTGSEAANTDGCDTESVDPDEPSQTVEDGIRGEYACASKDKNGCQADVCAAISALNIPSVYLCSSPCGECEYVTGDCEEALFECLTGVCVDPDEADFALLLDCSMLYRECVAPQEG